MVIPNDIVFEEVESCIARGEEVTIPFKGRSMEPYLREGDRITLAPIHKVRRGDVLLFRHQGQHLLHRVVCRRGLQGLITLQGDASRNRERVGEAELVAKLATVNPQRWDWRRWRVMLSPWYFAFLFILMWGYFGGIPIESNFIFGIRLDHLIHASVYIPCTWFILRRRPWLLACGVALLTESVQYLLPYRGFDINDLVANLLGVFLGWVLYRLAAVFIRAGGCR